MNISPFVSLAIQYLPKVVPTLKKLYQIFKDNDPLVQGLSLAKKGVKMATIAVLTAKEVVKSTPTKEDDIKFNEGKKALIEIRDNLNEVIAKIEE